MSQPPQRRRALSGVVAVFLIAITILYSLLWGSAQVAAVRSERQPTGPEVVNPGRVLPTSAPGVNRNQNKNTPCGNASIRGRLHNLRGGVGGPQSSGSSTPLCAIILEDLEVCGALCPWVMVGGPDRYVCADPRGSFVPFINGPQGSRMGKCFVVVTNSPEGDRVSRSKARWYFHNLSQRSQRTHSSRSEPVPSSGYRPRARVKKVWGRSLRRTRSEGDVPSCTQSLFAGDDEEPPSPSSVGSESDLGGDSEKDEIVDCILYRVNPRVWSVVSGSQRLVIPLLGGEDEEIASALGFRGAERVTYNRRHFESVCQKIAGMRVASAHTIDSIRFQCATLGYDISVLPRIVLQWLMFTRVRDNSAGSGETGISVSALNSLAPVSNPPAYLYSTLRMSPIMLTTSTMGSLWDVMRGAVELCRLVTSRRGVTGDQCLRLRTIAQSLGRHLGMGALSFLLLTAVLAPVATGCFMIKLVLQHFTRASASSFRNQGFYVGLQRFVRGFLSSHVRALGGRLHIAV